MVKGERAGKISDRSVVTVPSVRVCSAMFSSQSEEPPRWYVSDQSMWSSSVRYARVFDFGRLGFLY